MLINSIAATGANYIGEAKYNGNINTPTQLLLHAGIGYLQGELNYGEGISGAVGEGSAEYYKNNAIKNGATVEDIPNIVNTGGNIAKFMGALTGALISKTSSGVYAGSDAAENSAKNNSLNTQHLTNQILWKEAQQSAEATAKVMKGVTDVAIPLISEAPIPIVGSPRENIELITGKDFYDGVSKNREDIIIDKSWSYAVDKTPNPISIPYNTYDYGKNIYNGYDKLQSQEMEINGNNVVFYPKR